jgi:hypothetical protein
MTIQFDLDAALACVSRPDFGPNQPIKCFSVDIAETLPPESLEQPPAPGSHHFGCTPCGPPGLPGGGMTAVDPVDGAGFSIFGSTSFGRITPLEAPSLSLSVPGCLVNVLFGLGETV